MTWRSLAVVLALGPLALAEESPKRQVVEAVVAKVNDEIITQSSFRRSFTPIREQIEQKHKDDPAKMMEVLGNRERAFLETMVDNLLLTQRARSLGLKVGEDEVREVVDRLMLENALKTQEDLILALKGEGIDFEDFKADLRNQGFREKLIQQEILRKITVSDAEITAYYEDHLDAFAVPARVHLREVGLGTDRAHAADLWQKASASLQEGRTFAQVAKELSESPSREKEGDLGWFAKGDLDPAVEAAVVSLKIGEMTPIVASSYGQHVFLIEERQEAGRRPLAEAKGEVEERLRRSKYDDDLDILVRKLRDEADIRYKSGSGVLVEAKSLDKVKGS